MQRVRTLCVLFACVFVARYSFANTASFQNLGTGSYATMSRSGQYVLVVRSNGDVYRWSAATGQTSLGLNVGTNGFATGVSDDGTIVAGYHRNASNVTTGFRWTAPSGFTDLGDLPGGSTYSLA